ncbi:MAG: phage major capsid protein [Oscillospiraceae bacterium]|nr:phage major capsid protein [Oscillospiraceae bacterium]
MTINELRSKRAQKLAATKAFLESNRNSEGFLSAEDDAVYTRMEGEITSLGNEIARMERLEAMDAQLSKPVNTPITEKPAAAEKEDRKTGRSADAYKKAFWNRLRIKDPATMAPDLRNALLVGDDAEGGYLVPDEFEKTLIDGLQENTIIRRFAHVITTSSGVHKIPVVVSHGSAAWLDEEAAYTESDDVFGQVQLDAHKVGTTIKVSEELLRDSAFDLEEYIQNEFIRRIGDKEEEAFLVGNGSSKPTGILNATGGADVGVTAASATAITADEVIDLYYSLKAPYRQKAVWVLNDATVKLIRKLKDTTGQYLWQPALKDGEVNTILGRPYYTSPFAPVPEAGAKAILFGDLNYYWIGDRQGISIKRLNELYANNGQVGFLASKRLDGRLVLPEAIKVLQMKAS